MTRKPNGTRCCGGEAYYSSADGGRCSVCGKRNLKEELTIAADHYGDLCMRYGAALDVDTLTPIVLRNEWLKLKALIEEALPDDD